jgi:hypothetical protein
MKPELHLDVSSLQRPVLHMHMDMSTSQRSELHLPGQQEPVLLLEVSIPHGHELHLDVAAQ